uniref:kelch-like protein 12 n=1 Tax=Styela clava TaxID=7725 RepID=UPI00193A1C09|nr:kelch-like protein 12 [Styela clava]
MEVERTIPMDKNAHDAELLENLNRMRENKMFCDFLIKAGSEEIPVHKNVVSAGSDYFKAMLSHDTKESQAGVVDIKESNPVCVKKCIDFIYTGTGSVADENREELMLVAHMMQLQRLCDGIASFLETDLSPDSFVSTKRIAHMFECKNLIECCKTYSLDNFCSIANSCDFKFLEHDYISFLMESKNTKASVADKCKALLIWTQHEPDNRAKCFEEIFKTFDLSKLRFEYVKYLVENEPLVFNSATCLRPMVLRSYQKDNIEAKDHVWSGQKEKNVIAVFDKTSKSIQAFDPVQKKWTKMQTIFDEIASKQFVAVVLESDLYILGRDGSCFVLSNYSEPSTVWRKLSNRKHTGRLQAVAFQGSLYALDDSSDTSIAVEKLTPSEGLWSQFTNKTVASRECAVTATREFIYCFGGYNGSTVLLNSLKLDPCVPKWHALPDLPSKRCGACISEVSGKMFVMGGTPSPGYLDTVDYLDLMTETWVTATNMNQARYNFSSCEFSSRIYVCGGSKSSYDIEEYDPLQNSWKVIGTTSGK